MDIEKKPCNQFPSNSTSSKTDIITQCKPENKEDVIHTIAEQRSSCSNIPSSHTSSSSVSTGYFHTECKLHQIHLKPPPNISYELAIAKSALQKYSTLSGDNLFDHLSDIIKRVIDERPPDVIDFFEEFSRNVREQKLHLPERFPPDGIYEDSRLFKIAKRVLLSMKLPTTDEIGIEGSETSLMSPHASPNLALELRAIDPIFKTFNERVQKLQFYWNQCGFSISSDDIFQLACSMSRLQTHPFIHQCRFWGVINGQKSSYYVAEALLTREVLQMRLELMKKEMQENQTPKLPSKKNSKILSSHIGPELIPGFYGWENCPKEELEKMQPAADPPPMAQEVENYDIPPELVGRGLNRYSYYVVNTLSDEWIELPIVTPKQIMVSRHIKKFCSGDLESEMNTYPCFPGKEKHYLRTIIARITSGTYIAPHGYYRKMTNREKRVWEGFEQDEEEEEEEEENIDAEEESKEFDNDIMLLRNEKYIPQLTETMVSLNHWVHVRPNILDIQGRVVWFDEEKARKMREKALARLLREQILEELEEEEDEEEAENEGEEEELLEEGNPPEIGPPILQSCDFDTVDQRDFTLAWTPRSTSKFTNKNERVLVMRSNIWPGAYTFIFENMCESVYMGWGHKYTARNMPFRHLPPTANEYPHKWDDFIETTDPTFADEEAYRLLLIKRQMHPNTLDVEGEDEFEDEMPGEENP